ncbi:T9SS type A sorting domain-containing protein [Neolewinella lacunae]|nr:T9SS type A sorting domain-containing protein [Neolewinella lacunae]
MMMKILLSLGLLLAVYGPLAAEITVLTTQHSSSTISCNGSATVRATGTAGPFTVRLYDSVNDEEIEYTEVYGDLTIGGLCNVFYEISVFPSRFPSCSKFLAVDLVPTIEAKLAVEGLTEGSLLVSVSPNPANSEVEVTTTGLPLQGAEGKGNWSVHIIDAAGKRYQHAAFSSQEKGLEKAVFPLSLGGLQKGIYFIQVTRADGATGTGRVVLQ